MSAFAKVYHFKKRRLIERSIYQEDLEENAERVNQNPEYYRERQQVTEHQFGTLKRHWGFTYTLMKTRTHVLTEVNLMMICYNLRRLMSIFFHHRAQEQAKRPSALLFISNRLHPSPFKPLKKPNNIIPLHNTIK